MSGESEENTELRRELGEHIQNFKETIESEQLSDPWKRYIWSLIPFFSALFYSPFTLLKVVTIWAMGIYDTYQLIWLSIFSQDLVQISWGAYFQVWAYTYMVLLTENLLIISSLVPIVNFISNFGLIVTTFLFERQIVLKLPEIIVIKE